MRNEQTHIQISLSLSLPVYIYTSIYIYMYMAMSVNPSEGPLLSNYEGTFQNDLAMLHICHTVVRNVKERIESMNINLLYGSNGT